ncbi:hypothetical protein JADG_007466 [Aureobasidium aubasidani]|nr:hypothetical protein JADG_007466 [Aureobasidium pullulans]
MAYKITVDKCEAEIPGGHWIHTPGTNLDSGIYALAIGLACDPSETVPRHLRWEDESPESHNYRGLAKILRVLERQSTFPQLKEGEILDTNVLVQILKNWDTLMKGRSVIWFEKDHNLSGETSESGTKKIILRALGDTRWAVFTNFIKPLYNIETDEETPSWTTIQPYTEEQEDTAIDNLKRLARVFDGGAVALEPPIETLMTTRYRVDHATELVQATIKSIDHVKGLLSTSLKHLDMTRQQLQIHESEQKFLLSASSIMAWFRATSRIVMNLFIKRPTPPASPTVYGTPKYQDLATRVSTLEQRDQANGLRAKLGGGVALGLGIMYTPQPGGSIARVVVIAAEAHFKQMGRRGRE